MSVCTFFGHSECYGLDANVLKSAVEELIHKGVNTFYVGHQGHFDGMVFSALLELEKVYPNISISVVLAYLPTKNSGYDPYQEYSMYPEGIEIGPRRFSIERRNKWMIARAAGGYCLCLVSHTWGGAYKFAKRAKSQGLTIVNLGTAEL